MLKGINIYDTYKVIVYVMLIVIVSYLALQNEAAKCVLF